ncbi:MAG: hypothetical protein JW996_01065 [Candidatus Cloacimonetes bacterium]|nr:hypothetical protein [Candidatus Cloacimonadota bacterium]
MKSKTEKPRNCKLIKSLLTSLIVWIVGLFIYMLPGFALAIKMGFELGPKSDDPAAVSQQISETISRMYQDSIILYIVYFVVLILLIFWRARIITLKYEKNSLLCSILVSFFPIVTSLIFFSMVGFNLSSLIVLFGFLAAGYLGGNRPKSLKKTHPADEEKMIDE